MKRIDIAQKLALMVRDADMLETVMHDTTVVLSRNTWTAIVELSEQFRISNDGSRIS